MATKNSEAGKKAAATKAANKAAAATADAPAKATKAVPVKAAAPVKKTPAVKAKPAPAAEPAQAQDDDAGGEDSNVAQIGRKELASAVHDHMKAAGFGAPEKLCVQLIQSLESVVADSLAKGVDVVLPGFGKFKTTLRAAGERRNPRSGESMTVAASWAVGFKPGKTLKDAANTRPAG